ncbi:hypothetical protein GT360_17880 [Vibrio astriarenae]|uniref:HTH cro/C1-type domain-containing protein n=1 Tax=Vibrio astriarenae TaxID=1481923 RepID=A0A7Z2T6Y8_9VIBR|nr:helix-turn-helix domain-containing protein [Vibrio astriarenae]QIA65410.1 hypothetical protein GT360_17880 [Vibrio astriarenae]
MSIGVGSVHPTIGIYLHDEAAKRVRLEVNDTLCRYFDITVAELGERTFEETG